MYLHFNTPLFNWLLVSRSGWLSHNLTLSRNAIFYCFFGVIFLPCTAWTQLWTDLCGSIYIILLILWGRWRYVRNRRWWKKLVQSSEDTFFFLRTFWFRKTEKLAFSQRHWNALLFFDTYTHITHSNITSSSCLT